MGPLTFDLIGLLASLTALLGLLARWIMFVPCYQLPGTGMCTNQIGRFTYLNFSQSRAFENKHLLEGRLAVAQRNPVSSQMPQLKRYRSAISFRVCQSRFDN